MQSAPPVEKEMFRVSRAKKCSHLALAFGGLLLLAACADEARTVEKVTTKPVPLNESTLDHYKLRKSPKGEWKLPNRLSEISGLATTSEGRIFAHNDERGIIYEIDIGGGKGGGKIRKSFHLGPNGLKADFEGIAIAEKAIFLVTSEGTIYQTVEGAADEEVQYTTYDTGIGDVCEVEGLEYEPSDHTLLLACKTTRGTRLENGVAVFRWSVANRALSEPNFIWVPNDKIGLHLPQEQFHPSGIARHPASGTYFIISAREHALIEITLRGEIVAAENLKSGRHPHAEGIAVVARKSGTFDLLISDEGDGRRARLARYRDRSRKKSD